MRRMYREVLIEDYSEAHRRSAVVFISTSVEARRLREAIQHHYATRSLPEILRLVRPIPASNPTDLQSTEAAIPPDIFNAPAGRLRTTVINFDQSGAFHSKDEIPGALEAALERRRRKILIQGDGLLASRNGFHYGKPSGLHSDRFVRTANAFIGQAETDLFAVKLLSYLPNDLRAVYTDTASINALVFACLRLRERITGVPYHPIVESFSSYEGLREEPEFADQACWLISVSTTGGLERKIVDAFAVPKERVVTVFRAGAYRRTGPVICELASDQIPPNLKTPTEDYFIPPIASQSHETCGLCANNSRLVNITGDAFLPEDPSVHPFMLRSEDAPPWLGRTMDALIGSPVAYVHRGVSGSSGERRQLFLDLLPVIETGDGELQGRYRRALARVLPASCGLIVHLDDAASTAMAEQAQSILAARNIQVPLRREDRIQVEAEKLTLADGAAIFVTAATAVSGRTMQRLSQALRDIPGEHAIIYLIYLARTENPESLGRIERDLSFGVDGPRSNPFISVNRIFLPEDGPERRSPWTLEHEYLEGLEQFIAARSDIGLDDETYVSLTRRRELIGPDQSGGLRDGLFWPPCSTDSYRLEPRALILRERFAYWQGIEYEDKYSCADVFLTMSAVLHGRRVSLGQEGATYYLHHARSVLDPGNFSRFNDGILQSALLRASTPWELDYSHDSKLSSEMCGLIVSLFERRKVKAGEALPEFALALAMGRVRLSARDEIKVARVLRQDRGILGVLGLWIADRAGTEPGVEWERQ